VAGGLVASLNRPGGNVTGVNFLANQLGGKRLGLLLELVPTVTVIAFLMDPSQRGSVDEYQEVEAASRQAGRKIVLVNAASERDSVVSPGVV
jgi:putative ABC transport system substrate-binding protein